MSNSLEGWARIILGPCEATDDDGHACTLTRGHVVDHIFDDEDS